MSPANELAHTLSSPDPVRQTRVEGRTATSLATLLDPDAEVPERGNTAAQPPSLPSYSNYNRRSGDPNAPYGPDPANGGAPIILNSSPVTQNDAAPVPAAKSQGNSARGVQRAQHLQLFLALAGGCLGDLAVVLGVNHQHRPLQLGTNLFQVAAYLVAVLGVIDHHE